MEGGGGGELATVFENLDEQLCRGSGNSDSIFGREISVLGLATVIQNLRWETLWWVWQQ